MKKWLCLLPFFTLAAAAQKQNEKFYIFDSEWNAVKEVKNSVYFLQVINSGDTLFIARTYKTTGCMVSQESFGDEKLEIPNGRFAWYDTEGRIDLTGLFRKSVKTGSWAYYNDTLGLDQLITYDNGKETERRDYVSKTIISANGIQTFEEEKKYNDSVRASQPKDDEKEALFEGGPKGYRKYLERNLKPPENLYKPGNVRLALIINKQGKVEDIHLLKSLQYSADAEAFRVIGSMPAWTPAIQNGRNVYYQAIQNITFQ